MSTFRSKIKFSTYELAHNSNDVFMRLLIKCRMMHFRVCFALGHLFLKVEKDTFFFGDVLMKHCITSVAYVRKTFHSQH